MDKDLERLRTLNDKASQGEWYTFAEALMGGIFTNGKCVLAHDISQDGGMDDLRFIVEAVKYVRNKLNE